MPRLTQKSIEQASPHHEEFCLWDSEVVGLGLRVRPSGAKSFLLMYRYGGRQRKHTMGRLEVGYGLREARDRARELLRGLRDGVDPQNEKVEERSALSVADLFEAYLREGPALKPTKKGASWKTDRGIFDCHIRPLLGRRLARDLTKLDVAKFQLDVAQGKTARDVRLGSRRRSIVQGGKTVAGLAVAILGAAFQFGVETERLKTNPTKGVKRFQVQRRERFLSEQELSFFSEAMSELDKSNDRYAVMTDAIRLLILMGCRKNEILSLKWSSVDWARNCLRLADTKTGPRVVPLADAAVSLLRSRWQRQQGTREVGVSPPAFPSESGSSSPFVLPALKGEGHIVGLPKVWERIRVRADELAREALDGSNQPLGTVNTMSNVRLHDLRHSFASFAIADGASLFVVGKVLGHKQARTTEVYAHLSDDPIRSVANRTATRLAEAMRL